MYLITFVYAVYETRIMLLHSYRNAMQLLFNYSRKIYAYHLLFAWHIIEEYIKETKQENVKFLC